MAKITRRKFLVTTTTNIAAAGAALSTTSAMMLRFVRAADPETPKSPAQRDGFSFLHTYECTGRYWRGLEKAGLLRPTNGVRLVNSPWGEPSRRFNEVAKIGGPLDQILKQRKCHFIVDRVVGGSPYCTYTFDAKLIDHYRSMLGEKLLGGQVHETISNVRGVDWNRIAQARKTLGKETLTADDLRNYFTGKDAPHWLDYGTPESYAGQVAPTSEDAWWKEFQRAAKTQGARFNSRFSYCEGTHWGRWAWHIFYKFGAAYCIVEVGPLASEQSQLAVASLRGAARAAGRPWGIFFAPWGPKGCTCFVPAEQTSWQVPEQALASAGYPFGPQYGCSSALQRRIFFHAYLSGAHTLHEEWGAEGNLLDWDEGKLSSYGHVTRDFLDFQDTHPDVGEPFTPIALVLDAAVPPPAPTAWKTPLASLFQYAEADKANAARKGSGKEEAACYPPCALPELFDVVPSDAPADVWKDYQEIIPVGSALVPPGVKDCPAEEVYDRLAAAVQKYSPFARSSYLSMQVNRRKSDGAWIVGLYNPWGAVRGDVDNTGSVLNEECAIEDVLRPTFAVQSARVLHAWPRSSKASLEGEAIRATVGPGGTLILEIVPKR